MRAKGLQGKRRHGQNPLDLIQIVTAFGKGDSRHFGEGFRHYMSLPLAELRELRPEDRQHLIEGFRKAGIDW